MERERTRKLGESGWLHAPACEPRHSSTELLSKPWLHAPACEDSQPGSNFSTQHGAGRVERRQVPKCRWLHALACEHSQPGNSFQEEWTIQPAAQEETDKDPKARLAPRSGVRAKPAWQMDPEGRDGCTLRRAKTASQATTSQHNTALAGFKNVERERTRKLGESGWLHAPACEPRHSSTELLSKPWLHAPACEDSQPGSNFSTQHGAGRVERRQVPKCRWLHALACEHSQPGNSFQEEWTIQPAAQEETDKDPKARLAPRSGVRAKPAWQMDPEGRDGCTLRRAKTASQATTSQHNTALAGFKNVERDNKKTWRVRLAPRPSVRTKALFHRVTVKAVAPRSGVRTQPAWQ